MVCPIAMYYYVLCIMAGCESYESYAHSIIIFTCLPTDIIRSSINIVSEQICSAIQSSII